MHRWNTTQLRIDLWNECSQLQLLGELAGVKIPDRSRLNFARVDLGVINRFLAGLDDQMPDRFPFLLQIALKIGAPAAENVNWLTHNPNFSQSSDAVTTGHQPPNASRPVMSWPTMSI